jgi:hypothetical protein
LAALANGFHRHDRLGVVAVPAPARALQAARERLARRLSRAAADLPALRMEFGITDHLPLFAHVIHQPIRRRSPALQRHAPLQQPLPARLITVALEHLLQLAGPALALLVVVASISRRALCTFSLRW